MSNAVDARAAKQLEAISAFRRLLQEQEGIVDPLIQQLETLGAEFYGDTSINVQVVGDVKLLGRVWGAFRRAGYQSYSRPAKNEPSWSGWFHHDNAMGMYLSFTSTVCRRVKIGSQMVMQDVYSVECGGAGEAEEEIPF